MYSLSLKVGLKKQGRCSCTIWPVKGILSLYKIHALLRKVCFSFVFCVLAVSLTALSALVEQLSSFPPLLHLSVDLVQSRHICCVIGHKCNIGACLCMAVVENCRKVCVCVGRFQFGTAVEEEVQGHRVITAHAAQLQVKLAQTHQRAFVENCQQIANT